MKLSDQRIGGAGGNRTPVHQAMSVRDTTIPDFETDAISPTGRMFSYC